MISRLYDFVAGTIIDPQQVDAEFDQIIAQLAELDNSNIKVGANIQGSKLADAPNGVPTAKINDSAVATAKLADLAVTPGKLADLAVTRAKLGLQAVGYDQVEPLSLHETVLVDSTLTVRKDQIYVVKLSRVTSGYTFTAGAVLYLDLSQSTPSAPDANWRVTNYPADMVDGDGNLRYIPISIFHKARATTEVPLGFQAGYWGNHMMQNLVASDTTGDTKRWIIAHRNLHSSSVTFGLNEETWIYFKRLS